MKRLPLRLILYIGLGLTPFYYVSCKKSDNTPATSASKIQVKLATSATFGSYLVDKNGVTLYFYSNDYKGNNSCAGGCAAFWPYFYAGALTQDSLGTGLNLADFDTIHVGGTIQTRYKGWPLYYYSPNGNGTIESPGQITGDGVSGVWFVAKPDYTIMLANAQLVGLDGNNYTSSYTIGTGNTIYMTDAKGMTLYTFSADSFKINTFTKSDFSNNTAWPIYDTTQIVVPSALDKSNFSTTSVAGHIQLAYKGWPLYYFGQDMDIRGNNKGVSEGAPGKWPVPVANMNAAPQKKQSTSGKAVVKIDTSSTLGDYLVDKNGVSLYFYANDYKGIETCTSGCAVYWPAFYAGALTQDSLGTGLNLADFDTIHVGGTIQTRYKGWPLYYYSPNGNGTIEPPGQITGDGVSGVWFVAKPDYTIMLANAQLVGLDGNNYTSSYTIGTGNTIYMTDAKGMTLYTFSADSFKINTFTKSDFSNNTAWPIYDTTQIVVPSALDKSNFSTTSVAGHIQLTYKGWPLYYFGQDMNIRGNNKGVSEGAPGKWPVPVANMNAAPQ